MEVEVCRQLRPDVQISGFLELGRMLALLFYHAGGCPRNQCNNDYYYHYYNNDNNDNCTTMQGRHASECGRGCGCSVAGCGKSLCYVASSAMLSIVDGVLEALVLGDLSTIVTAVDGNFPWHWTCWQKWPA
jgi:hypothetical protein